jgi:hypothetical protein
MFAKIADLQPSYTPISLLALIVSCKPVRKSRGEDYAMSMILRDCSCSSPNQFISVNLFQRNPQDLPDSAQNGNVVMLKNLKIKPFESTVQAVSTFGFKFALFQWDFTKNTMAFKCASKDFCLTQDVLEEASKIYIHFHPGIIPTSNRKAIQSEGLEDEEEFSLAQGWKAKQASASPSSSLELPQLLTAEQFEWKEMKFSFIGQVLQVLASNRQEQRLLVSLSDFTSSKFILCSKEIAGFPMDSVLNVIFTGIDAKAMLEAVEIEDFILCTSILATPKNDGFLSFKLQNSMIQGTVGFTKIQPQSPLINPIIKLRKKLIHPQLEESESESEFFENHQPQQQRIESKAKRERQYPDLFEKLVDQAIEGVQSSSSLCLPDERQEYIEKLVKSKKPTSIPSRYLFTFDQILKYKSFKEEPIKFICKFRIQSTIPRDPSHFTLPLCRECKQFILESRINGSDTVITCENCKELTSCPREDKISFAYRFVVEAYEEGLEESARPYPVLITGEEAEKLLGGIVATDLENDSYSLNLVQRSIDAILVGKLVANAVIIRYFDSEHKEFRFRVSRFLFFSPPNTASDE